MLAVRAFQLQGEASIHTFRVQRVLGIFGFRHVYNPVDVKRHFLRARRPALVAEAVDVFAVRARREGVVLGGDGLLMVLEVSAGIFDLEHQGNGVSIQFLS